MLITHLKSIMILHYFFCKHLVPWMSPPCIAMLLENGDWPEIVYINMISDIAGWTQPIKSQSYFKEDQC